MTADYFLDSNVLLYAFSFAEEDASKREVSRKLLLQDGVGISAQVIQEFINSALRKPALGISETGIDVMIEFASELPVVSVSYEVIAKAVGLRRSFQLSHWDSTILAAAEAMGCSVLYSEDLSHGQSFGQVRVINPFRGL